MRRNRHHHQNMLLYFSHSWVWSVECWGHGRPSEGWTPNKSATKFQPNFFPHFSYQTIYLFVFSIAFYDGGTLCWWLGWRRWWCQCLHILYNSHYQIISPKTIYPILWFYLLYNLKAFILIGLIYILGESGKCLENCNYLSYFNLLGLFHWNLELFKLSRWHIMAPPNSSIQYFSSTL